MYSVAPLTFLRNALRLYVMQTKIQGWESNRCFIMIVLSPWNFVWSITKFRLCADIIQVFKSMTEHFYQVSNKMKLYTTSIKIETTTFFRFIDWVCDGLYACQNLQRISTYGSTMQFTSFVARQSKHKNDQQIKYLIYNQISDLLQIYYIP